MVIQSFSIRAARDCKSQVVEKVRLPVLGQLPRRISCDILVLQFLPFGMDIPAPAKADLQFYLAAAKIHFHGDDGQPLLLVLGAKVNDLPLVQKQTARPLRVVLVVLAGLVRSEERRVGKEWATMCRYRWAP